MSLNKSFYSENVHSKKECHIFSIDLVHYIYIFLHMRLLKIPVLTNCMLLQVRSMPPWERKKKEIKAGVCQAHLIINIWVERLGGGIELSLCSSEFLHSPGHHGGP